MVHWKPNEWLAIELEFMPDQISQTKRFIVLKFEKRYFFERESSNIRTSRFQQPQ